MSLMIMTQDLKILNFIKEKENKNKMVLVGIGINMKNFEKKG